MLKKREGGKRLTEGGTKGWEREGSKGGRRPGREEAGSGKRGYTRAKPRQSRKKKERRLDNWESCEK